LLDLATIFTRVDAMPLFFEQKAVQSQGGGAMLR